MTGSESFRRGVWACVPALPTLFFIFFGYGVASQTAGVPPAGAMAMTLLVYAAPAQYAIMDSVMGGATVVQLIFVGVLANLRFFVMSLALAKMFAHTPRRLVAPWAHFVAATPFLLTFFQSRKEQPGDLFDFFRGIALPMIPAIVLGTAVGIWIGDGLPPALQFGAGLFLPIYFSLLLAADVRGGYEMAAVALGFALTPPLDALLPGWGLALAAMGAGAAMTVIER